MDISALFSAFRQFGSEFAKSYCIINGSIMKLDDIQGMGLEEFFSRSKFNMPMRLYRYYPNTETNMGETDEKVNYSLQALEDNTVYLQSPLVFDDIYDSDINIDYLEYEHFRLIEYCRRCGMKFDSEQSTQQVGNAFVKHIWECCVKNGHFDHLFTKEPESKIEELSNQLFEKRVLVELGQSQDLGKAVSKIIYDEYIDYISSLKTTFRTTCFATTPYSQLMWGGAYANCHNGFCIEYTVLPNTAPYAEIYDNLFR